MELIQIALVFNILLFVLMLIILLFIPSEMFRPNNINSINSINDFHGKLINGFIKAGIPRKFFK